MGSTRKPISTKGAPAPAAKKRAKRIRYAVIGQGYIAQSAVLPSFAHAKKNSELVALISDDPVKLEKLSATYDVAEVGGYDDYDALLASGEIDAVYIALPNHLHLDYTLRAARAGVHVLCEKPMAVTEAECQQMTRECRKRGVKLMIAYRLHFEQANLAAIEVVQSGKLGEPRIFSSIFTMQVVDPENIRLQSETGGGVLYDIGVYCINAARYLFRDEPLEVYATTARSGEKRFADVEEMASVVMRFPGERLASFTCSFGAAHGSQYEVVGTRGSLRVEPAYSYSEDLKHVLTIDGKSRERVFAQQDQFGPQLLYFSDCVLKDREPEPSGEEGLIDVRIINALYESALNGSVVKLPGLKKRVRPALKQAIKRPPIAKPALVRASSPSGKH
jgi:glucose-fructose oxidoreductase